MKDRKNSSLLGCRLKLRWLFLFSLFAGPLTPPLEIQSTVAANNIVQQQKISVTGTVVDGQGEPIIGANVVVQGQTTGTITDIDGIFKLDVTSGAKLTISFIGYDSKTVIAKKGNMRIVLEDNSQMLGEVEVVAYGAQKKVTVTGAISSVKGEEITRTPVSSVTNVLAGQMTGLTTVQYSGEPGSDAANIFVRGKATWVDSSPLIQVDGVERSMNDIDPNEIESITVLKDASATAVFGVRGANGVILITTKRGKEGKAKISFTTSASAVTPTKMVEQAGSYDYATFHNMMNRLDGSSERFPVEVIQKFKDHSDPIRFPDMHWADYIMKDVTLQTQHNINITGGTDKVRYFISAGAYTQGGLFNEFNLPYNVSYQYRRFNYRSNLDIDVTKTTTLSFNIGGNVNNADKPYTGQGSAGMIKNMYYATPFSSAGIVDGKFITTATDYSDVQLPFTGGTGMAYYGAGFMQTNNNTLNADLILNQKLDFLTKGLSMKIKGSYNSAFTVSKKGEASVATYTPILQPDGSLAYRKYGETSDAKYVLKDTEQGKARDWYMEVGLNYARSFGNHNVSALLLYNQSKSYYPKYYSDIPTGYVGLVGRVTYDWKNRYLAEFNIGYNGSENFAPENRFGTFPAGSIGWVLSEEKFWKPIKSVVSFFKLRATWGLVGNDKITDSKTSGRFLYLADPYQTNNGSPINRPGYGYIFGTNTPSTSKGSYEQAKNNPKVTWETAFKQNYGFDMNFFEDRLKTTFEYYIEHRRDILLRDATAPSLLGFTVPFANMGSVNSWGWELSLKWNDKIDSDFRYWIGLNISQNQNEIIEMKEAPQNNQYQYQKGHRIGSASKYLFWRFYDENTPELYEKTFGKPFPEHPVNGEAGMRPGDAVYVDLDGNGVIDANDMSRDYGYTDDPQYMAGLNLGFSWKNWEFSTQWTAAWNVSRLISDVFRQPFYQSSDPSQGGLLAYHLNHTWTEENPSQNAEYPRPTWTNTNNNYATSTLYEKDAKYIRLKTLQLAYNFHFPLMDKLKLSTFQLAFSGYNLLTFTPYLWGDPETRASNAPSYPLSRTYSLSLKLGF